MSNKYGYGLSRESKDARNKTRSPSRAANPCPWMPSSIKGAATLNRCRYSNVRGCTAAAFDPVASSGLRSMITQSTPNCARPAAMARPAGPAPTMRTSVLPGRRVTSSSFQTTTVVVVSEYGDLPLNATDRSHLTLCCVPQPRRQSAAGEHQIHALGADLRHVDAVEIQPFVEPGQRDGEQQGGGDVVEPHVANSVPSQSLVARDALLATRRPRREPTVLQWAADPVGHEHPGQVGFWVPEVGDLPVERRRGAKVGPIEDVRHAGVAPAQRHPLRDVEVGVQPVQGAREGGLDRSVAGGPGDGVPQEVRQPLRRGIAVGRQIEETQAVFGRIESVDGGDDVETPVPQHPRYRDR